METLQISSPRRHIHSSFPHYFYSTPSSPSSDTISAFVTLCESKIKSNSDDNFAFSFNSTTTTADVAFADDLFSQGQLLPAVAPSPPLKLPPRLQYIANIRKSLRVPRLAGRSRQRKKVSSPKKDDPFVVAVEKVRREDAPWCQLPTWHRRAKVEGIVEESTGLICEEEGRRKESWMYRWLRNITMKGNKERSKVDEDERDGKKLVSLSNCTSVNKCSMSRLGRFKFLGCFSFQ